MACEQDILINCDVFTRVLQKTTIMKIS